VDANDLLMGGGVKSASFPDGQYGVEVGGIVVRPPTAKQVTDFDTNKPKFYDNGDPIMQVVVHVQTGLRDPQDSLDDGVRALYIKGQMTAAVRDAVRRVGGKGIEVGGELHVRYERDEPNSRGRGKDKKIYSAQYQLPTAQAANTTLMGGNGSQGSQGSAVQSAPTPATPNSAFAQPAAAEPQPPIGVGVDPALWAVLSAEQRNTVLAAAANR
jgi:hypothetical protein